MKAKVTRPDGTVIEVEGDADDVLRVLGPPQFTPAVSPPPVRVEPAPYVPTVTWPVVQPTPFTTWQGHFGIISSGEAS